MQTAAILDIPEAATLVGVKPIELYRARVRGQLKVRSVPGGKDRVLADDLKAWISYSSGQDSPMPKVDGDWFEGEYSLNMVCWQVEKAISAELPEGGLVSLEDAQAEFNRTGDKTRTIRRAFHDPKAKLRAKPSTLFSGPFQRDAQALDERFGTILTAFMAVRLREHAFRELSIIAGKNPADMHKTKIEKLYMPENYARIIGAYAELSKRIVSSEKQIHIVKDKRHNGLDTQVLTTIDFTIADSILPPALNVIRAAF